MIRVARVLVSFAAAVSLIVAFGPEPRAQNPRVTFAAPTTVELGAAEPVAQVSGDFNQDGHLDLMVTPFTSVLTGSGSGALTELQRVTFFGATGIAAGDFTGDGALDVAITQAADKGFGYGDTLCGSLPSVGIFVQPGMTHQAPCLFAGFGPVAVQTSDFNGDGTADLAVVSRQAQGLRILSGRGDGTFEPFVANGPNGIVPGSLVNAISLAPATDFTGDGKLDLVVAHTSGLRTFVGNGDGTFLPGASIGDTPMRGVAASDVNADGFGDLVSIDAPVDPVTRVPAPGRLLVHIGAADGTFATQVVSTIGLNLTDLAVTDLDADGHQDILVAHAGGGAIRIFFGDAAGNFVADAPLALSVRPKLLAVRDWDEDGDLDLVIVDSQGSGQNAVAWIALQGGAGQTDVTPPTVMLTSPADGATVSGTVAVTASASDNVGVTRVEFYAGTTLIAKSAGPNFAVAWDTTTVPDGPVTLMARAFDAALNESEWATVAVTIANAAPPSDTVPPVVTVPANATIEATGPAGAVFTYTASAADNVDGPLPVTCEPASGSTYPLGATPVACSATDARGNTGWASFTVAVVDTTAPEITVPANIIVDATSAAGALVTYVASASDAVDGGVAVTCTPPSGSTFPIGTTTVTCEARDTIGNTASRTFTVTVRVVTVPANDPPRARSASYTIAAGTTLTALLKARDRDGDALRFIIVSNPAKGTVAILDANTGSFTYTPLAGTSGLDAFTFQVSDGRALSNVATVTIRVKSARHGDGAAEPARRRGGELSLREHPR